MHSTKLQIQHYKNWFSDWTKIQTLVIAGPCSAESYEQLEQSIQVMQQNSAWHVLRLGVWKPRSRPGGFEGNPQALEWIKELKKKYHFKCAVEVASPEHVQAARDAHVDLFWIGARTVGLPFAIEELANAMGDYDIPVLIKNPLSPDVGLWAGAVERFLAKGLQKIAIVHRGFSWPYGQELRNWPMWSAVAQMKLQFPEVTVIGDPSHIAGNSILVPQLANEALSFGCDGLMIETHPNPKMALTDAKQQISLEMMPQLLQSLKKPEVIVDQTTINFLRMHIDEIDQQLMHLLRKRDEITEKIATAKKDHQLQVVEYQRFQQMLDLRKQWFRASEEDHTYIDQFFNLLHERSIQRQLNIVSQSDTH